MMPGKYSTILSKLGEEINRLSKRVDELEQHHQTLETRNQELETENRHLKELLHKQGASKDAKTPKFKENYSVENHKGKGKGGERQRDDGFRTRS